MKKPKTVIMHHNIETGETKPSFYTEEWQVAVWAEPFAHRSIWFLQEVE